jgi:enediyne biosynthesis protein E4
LNIFSELIYRHYFRFIFFITVFCPFLILSCTSSSELDWHDENEYRWAELSPGFFGQDGFRKLSASKTGINFQNILTDSEIEYNRHYLNGSGVAAGDINGNGLTDLYFASLTGPNRLYLNQGGFRFEDVTERAGVAHEGYYSTGAVFADVNGNGHLDLLVTAMHGNNVLYLNDGSGSFTKSEDSGLGEAKGSITMALADLTGNGYPDLYITNYKERSVKDIYTTRELDWSNILNEPLRSPEDEYTLAPPFDRHYELVRFNGELTGITELGETDELYLNYGGRFERVYDTDQVFFDEYGRPMGLQPDWGLTAKFQDLNDNGLQDLYVCNDFHTPDRIWMNQGDGTFRAASWKAFRNLSYSCMAIDFSDINRNGRLDIFATEMLDPDHERRLRQAESDDHVPVQIGEIENRPMYNRNSLYLQREDHTFAEISYLAGVEATGWSWATRFMDVNLNGYEDLIVNTGYKYDILDIDAQFTMIRNRRNMDEHFMEFTELVDPLDQQNKILRNNGDLTFTDISSEWGFHDLDVSHGMAFADLNNNGTLDVIVNRMNSEAAVYENRTRAPRIAVQLIGRVPNTQAIGAKVELYGAQVHQQKEIVSGGDYASGSDTRVMFAADPVNQNHEIHIRWPDGSRSVIEGVHANRIYEVDQSVISVPEDVPETSEIRFQPLFEEVSSEIEVFHHEEPFNDFQYQPLLPFKLSQRGPGVAWLDLTGDGQDELLMASGRGGKMTVLKYDDESFSFLEPGGLTEQAGGDQTAVVGWKENGYTRVVVGSANYEQGSPNVPAAFDYKISEGGLIDSNQIPGIFSTTGPIAAADINGNGYPDLFIGGNFMPGQYPASADSRMIINDEGTFRLDQLNSQTFAGLGLVNGAVFADFSGNGSQDLLISTEWGTLRLFENNEGIFSENTEDMGLDKWSGWWKGIATGDFTNNGLPDIVALNIGLNSPYQIKFDDPLRIYYSDLDGFGTMDIIEAYPDGNGNYLPRHRLYKFQEQQIVLNHMSSHRDFASATVRQILGERYEQVPFKEINTLEHMVFINNGDHFEGRALPIELQFSAGFYAGVADFDKDGNEDLFISQNLFAVPPDMPRLDAGRGKILMGDGNGGFELLSGTESGVKVYGEQRGAALGDFNRDGRVDLAVSQNANRLKIFRNMSDRRGLSVTLEGPPSNGNGVGSGVQLLYRNGQKGPLRFILSGSGYWSQNSYTQILGYGDNQPDEIIVNWFDGTIQSVPIEEGVYNYSIRHPDH